VVVVGGEVGGVVVGGGVGVVVREAVVVGVVVDGEVGGVVVFPLAAEVPAGDGAGMVVTLEGAGAALCAGLATTTTVHFPHSSVTFPLTCPADVSPENQYSALPE